MKLIVLVLISWICRIGTAGPTKNCKIACMKGEGGAECECPPVVPKRATKTRASKRAEKKKERKRAKKKAKREAKKTIKRAKKKGELIAKPYKINASPPSATKRT